MRQDRRAQTPRRCSASRGFIPALLLVAATLCALPVAAHAAEFAAEGAVGDRADRDVCGPGEYLVGVRFRAGGWIDQVRILCARLERSNGTLGQPRSGGEPRGGNGGGDGIVTCPTDMWVTRMGFWFTGGNRQVRHVGMICEFPAPNGRPEQGFTFGAGPGGSTNPRHVCPSGEAAVGLNSRSGLHVNALGLICARTPSLGGDALPKQAPRPPSNAELCKDYAARMLARTNEYARLKCGTSTGEKTAAGHESQCLRYGAKAAEIIPFNESGMDNSLANCRKAAAGGGGTTTAAGIKTVVAEVTVYDKPQGNDVCYLKPDDKVTVLTGADIPESFRNPPDAKWVPVRGNTGRCNGEVGGVYNKGELK
jgi:hypothetical protein